MRALISLVVVLSAWGCAPSLDNACSLQGGLPTDAEVASGRLVATRDGAPFNEAASWSDQSRSLDAGTLSIIMMVDETGTSVTELIGRRAFPICVPLGERGDPPGQALFDSNFVTDAANTGSLSILDEDGGVIAGRLSVTLGDAGGGASTTFADGVYRATLR